MSDMVTLQICASPIKGEIKKEWSLKKKVTFAMKYALEHSEIYWMVGNATNDLKFRTAIAAVLLSDLSDEEKEMVNRSVAVVGKINAMFQHNMFGDIESITEEAKDVMPLIEMWSELIKGIEVKE